VTPYVSINLLEDMEHLDLIKVNFPKGATIATVNKLSGQFAGALKLSDARYDEYQKKLQKGRTDYNNCSDRILV
jgi:hypothetical protein